MEKNKGVIKLAQAAYPKIVKYSTVSAGDSGYATIPGINSASLTVAGDVLDDTCFSTDIDGYKSRMLGLNDFSMNISGDYSTDAGVVAILNAKLNRTPLWASYLPNGTSGFKGRYVVENFEINGEVAGKEQMTISLQGDGGFAATT